jgi:hypothetical protein
MSKMKAIKSRMIRVSHDDGDENDDGNVNGENDAPFFVVVDDDDDSVCCHGHDDPNVADT